MRRSIVIVPNLEHESALEANGAAENVAVVPLTLRRDLTHKT